MEIIMNIYIRYIFFAEDTIYRFLLLTFVAK